MHKSFRAAAGSLREARHFVTEHLENTGCCTESVEDATLLASEVATNAVQHATTQEFTLDVDVFDETIHVRIGDDDARQPTSRQCAADAESGRGLLLLDKIADRWGVRAQLTGKAVWFELPCWIPNPTGRRSPAAITPR